MSEEIETPAEEQTAPSSVAGLGVDIVEVERIERVLERTPRFRTRVFTEEERAYCDAKHVPAVHYATHFAAKEAVLKALGTGFSGGIKFTDVEVTHNTKGRPVPVLHGRAAEIAEENGVLELHLSLSRTHGTAVANAIAVTEASRPAPPEEKMSPKEELAAAFKELRGMLDEMDAPASDEDAPESEEIEGQIALDEEAAAEEEAPEEAPANSEAPAEEAE